MFEALLGNEVILLSVGVAIALSGSTYLSYVSRVYPLGVYAYVVSRIRVMNSRLLKEPRLNALIESYTAEDVIASFEGTIYEQYMPSGNSLLEVELALNKSLAETYNKIVKMSPSTAKNFFSWVQARYDIENLKAILAAKIAEKETGELFPGTFSETLNQRLIDAASLSEAIELLKNTKFEKIIESISSNPSLIEVERALDKYLYEELLSKGRIIILATNAGVINDDKFLTEIYARQADLINIKLVLRAKLDNISSEEIKNIVLKNRFNLDEKTLNSIIEADSVPSVISALEATDYFEPLNEQVNEFNRSGKLFLLEKALDQFYFKKIKSIFYKQSFGLSPIACFLTLKELEIRNLKTIMKGIQSSLPKQQIQDLVIFFGESK